VVPGHDILKKLNFTLLGFYYLKIFTSMVSFPSDTAVRSRGSAVSSPGKPGGELASFSSSKWGAVYFVIVNKYQKLGSNLIYRDLWRRHQSHLNCPTELGRLQMCKCKVSHCPLRLQCGPSLHSIGTNGEAPLRK